MGWSGVAQRTSENNSHLVHEWASTGRHARGNINGNAGNMIRQARNALRPADKVFILLSLPLAVVFFPNADELKASSTILGYLGMGVSAVLNVMLFAASLVSSNRWRKGQFR